MENLRDIDAVINGIASAVVDVAWEQLQVAHRSDDSGIWYFRRRGRNAVVQVESHTGRCPFLVESTISSDRFEAPTVEATVAEVVRLLAEEPS